MKLFSQPNSVPVGVHIFHILHSSPPEFDFGSFLKCRDCGLSGAQLPKIYLWIVNVCRRSSLAFKSLRKIIQYARGKKRSFF